MNKEIAIEVVEEIKLLPSGSEFSIGELLIEKGINNTKEMLEYYNFILKEIEAIVKTSPNYIGATVGLPFNIPLIKK